MREDTALSRRGFLRAAAGSAAAAGAVGGAAAQDGNESDGGNQTDGNQSDGGNETGGGNESDGGNQTDGGGGGGQTTPVSKTVTVGPGGDFTFDPETVKVTPGSTVTWEWDSDNHNIVVDSQPDDANWEGHESIENTGFTYENTFEVEGTYEYFCQPHQNQGMVGTVEVTQDISTPGGGGEGGGGPPPVPDSAKSLGVATTIGMLSTLGLAYFFLKYGGDYETPE